MASQPLEIPTQWTTSPRAADALEEALRANPQAIPEHTDKWDVSRSDIYYEDRWQPVFRDMRAAGDLIKVEDSPFGPYWNVVSHRAIQHIERARSPKRGFAAGIVLRLNQIKLAQPHIFHGSRRGADVAGDLRRPSVRRSIGRFRSIHR